MEIHGMKIITLEEALERFSRASAVSKDLAASLDKKGYVFISNSNFNMDCTKKWRGFNPVHIATSRYKRRSRKTLWAIKVPEGYTDKAQRRGSDALSQMVADFLNQVEDTLKQNGLTQRGFAKSLGINECRVSDALNNPRNLTLKTIVEWSDALGKIPIIKLVNKKECSK